MTDTLKSLPQELRFLVYYRGELERCPRVLEGENSLIDFFRRQKQKFQWSSREVKRHRYFRVVNGEREELTRQEIKKYWKLAGQPQEKT